MGHLLSWLGGLAGGYYLLVEIWADIEQPLLEFLLLGVIPGTDFVVEFDLALLLLVTIMFAVTLFSYRKHLKILEQRFILLRTL